MPQASEPDLPPTPSRILDTPADPTVDTSRRWFGGLLALLGGGAALSACEGTASGGVSAIAQGLTATDARWFDTMSAMESFDNASSTYTFAVLLGRGASGDGGGGIFTWTATLTPPTSDGGIIVRSTGATAGYWRRLYDGPINVLWFGAQSGASIDNAVPIQDAVNYAANSALLPGSTGAGVVYIPPGLYVVKTTVTVTTPNIHIRGSGVGSTLLSFQPAGTSAVTAFRFAGTGYSGRLASCSLKEFSILNNGSTNRKVGVCLEHTDGFLLQDVVVGNGWSSGIAGQMNSNADSMSLGVQIIGGQFCRVHRVLLAADIPILLDYDRDPMAVSVNVDHLHLSDLALGAAVGQANLFIRDKVWVTNLVLDGNSNFDGGSYGILWYSHNGLTTPHFNVSIRDLRVEGLTCITVGGVVYGHSIDIGRSINPESPDASSIQNLLIQNVHCASRLGTGDYPEGMRFRGALHLTLFNCSFPSLAPAIDLDGSCGEVAWHNCSFPTGGMWPTINSAGIIKDLRLVSASPQYLMPVSTGVARGTTSPVYPRLTPDARYINNTSGNTNRNFAPVQDFEGSRMRHAGNLADFGGSGSPSFTIAGLGVGSFKAATVTIVAHNAGATLSEGGVWLVTTTTVKQISGTTNTAAVDTMGKLWVSKDTYFVYLRHRLGSAVDFLITVDYLA